MRCPRCHYVLPSRKPKRAKRQKTTVRRYENSIKQLGHGREKYMTAEAKRKRREEVWLRDRKQCQIMLCLSTPKRDLHRADWHTSPDREDC